jgi:hypothetical protein
LDEASGSSLLAAPRPRAVAAKADHDSRAEAIGMTIGYRPHGCGEIVLARAILIVFNWKS